MLFDTTEPTRSKQGVLLSHTRDRYVADTWAVWGDSGGPILHKETGLALGIISGFNLPISTDVGPTMTHLLDILEWQGYDVTLQTAPATGATF